MRGWATEDARAAPGEGRPGKDLDELDRRRRSARLQAGAARHHTSLSFTNKIIAGADRQRRAASCRAAIRSWPRGGGLHRAPRPPRHRRARRERATRSTTARSTTPPAARRCSRSRGPSRRCRSGRAARSSSLFVAGEEQGCSARSTTPSTRPCPPGRSRPTSTIDGGNIWGRTRDVTSSAWASPRSTRSRKRSRRAGPRAAGRSVPRPRLFYRSDQFSFAKIGVPALYLDAGTDFIGQPRRLGPRADRGVRAEAATTSRATRSSPTGTSTA